MEKRKQRGCHRAAREMFARAHGNLECEREKQFALRASVGVLRQNSGASIKIDRIKTQGRPRIYAQANRICALDPEKLKLVANCHEVANCHWKRTLSQGRARRVLRLFPSPEGRGARGEVARAIRDARFRSTSRHGISTSLPVDCRDSMNLCASAACASGNDLPMSSFTLPSVISLSESSIPRRITSGTAATV